MVFLIKEKKVKFIPYNEVLKLFKQFIRETHTGIRVKKNGNKISQSTINNYRSALKILEDFILIKKFDFKLYLIKNISTKEYENIQKYWKIFYFDFTEYLYFDLNCFDNYVGTIIKNLKAFLNYLLKDLNFPIGNFHLSFYVPMEEIPIIALTPTQLNYLIYDKELCEKLPDKLNKVKDFFVFGCAVALRISDLLALRKENLYTENGQYYLKVISKKTSTFTSIKLPDFAIDILKKYKSRSVYILPHFSESFFNTQLKILGKYIDDKQEIAKYRKKRGVSYPVYKKGTKKENYTLADHLTSHTMRRTAITTMLRLGMPDYIVRKISGHAPNSKEFYRYVSLVQSYLDEQTDIMFKKLSNYNVKTSQN
jgi:integrase